MGAIITTIAYKDGLLAADTQETYGDIKLDGPPKIRTLPNGIIIACAGTVPKIKIAEEYFSRDDWEENLGDATNFKKDFEAILISKGRVLSCSGSCVATVVEHPFFAIGSGCHIALAAMHLGLSAPEAVKLASELDINTNNKVQVVHVQDILNQPAPKRAGRNPSRKAVSKA